MTAVHEVEVCRVDGDNWRQVAAVRVLPGQRAWVTDPTYYLCLCHYGGLWHPVAFRSGGEVVGFAMWAVDDADGSHWIGGFQVDRRHQGRGVGRGALRALVAWLADRGAPALALSYAPDNTAARRLYASEGFAETGETEDDEVVARRAVTGPSPTVTGPSPS